MRLTLLTLALATLLVASSAYPADGQAERAYYPGPDMTGIQNQQPYFPEPTARTQAGISDQCRGIVPIAEQMEKSRASRSPTHIMSPVQNSKFWEDGLTH